MGVKEERDGKDGRVREGREGWKGWESGRRKGAMGEGGMERRE